jgi:hypothetical protein
MRNTEDTELGQEKKWKKKQVPPYADSACPAADGLGTTSDFGWEARRGDRKAIPHYVDFVRNDGRA